MKNRWMPLFFSALFLINCTTFGGFTFNEGDAFFSKRVISSNRERVEPQYFPVPAAEEDIPDFERQLGLTGLLKRPSRRERFLKALDKKLSGSCEEWAGIDLKPGGNGGDPEVCLEQSQNILLETPGYISASLANDSGDLRGGLLDSDRAQSNALEMVLGGYLAGLPVHSRLSLSSVIYNPDPQDKSFTASVYLPTGLYSNNLDGAWYSPNKLSWTLFFPFLNSGPILYGIHASLGIGLNSPYIAIKEQNEFAHALLFGLPGYDWYNKGEGFLGAFSGYLTAGIKGVSEFSGGRLNGAASLGLGVSGGVRSPIVLGTAAAASFELTAGWFYLGGDLFAGLQAGLLPEYNRAYDQASWGIRCREGIDLSLGFNYPAFLLFSVFYFPPGTLAVHYGLTLDHSLLPASAYSGWDPFYWGNLQTNIGIVLKYER